MIVIPMITSCVLIDYFNDFNDELLQCWQQKKRCTALINNNNKIFNKYIN